jgi:pilus assembly protein TadC
MKTDYTRRLEGLLQRSAETDRRAADDLRELQAAGLALADAMKRVVEEIERG